MSSNDPNDDGGDTGGKRADTESADTVHRGRRSNDRTGGADERVPGEDDSRNQPPGGRSQNGEQPPSRRREPQPGDAPPGGRRDRPDQGGQSGEPRPSGRGANGQAGGYQPYEQRGTGLEPTVAAALAYVFGWISGLVLLVVEDDDEFVRFHAAQSVVVFGGLTVLWFVLATMRQAILVSGGIGLWGLFSALSTLVMLGGLAIWLYLMYVAYDGRWFRVPVAADIADSIIAGRSRPVQPRQPRNRDPTGQPRSDQQQPTEHRRDGDQRKPTEQSESSDQQRSARDQ